MRAEYALVRWMKVPEPGAGNDERERWTLPKKERTMLCLPQELDMRL